jgi:hypothetical protein
MVEYPSEDDIIGLNRKILAEIPVKRADPDT